MKLLSRKSKRGVINYWRKDVKKDCSIIKKRNQSVIRFVLGISYQQKINLLFLNHHKIANLVSFHELTLQKQKLL